MPFRAVEGDCDGESSVPAMNHANRQTTCTSTSMQHESVDRYMHITSDINHVRTVKTAESETA